MSFSRQYTSEPANVALGSADPVAAVSPSLLEFEDVGGFFDLLGDIDSSLMVTREYEHFMLALDGGPAGPWQSAFPLPHPSGMWFEPGTSTLTVASTRTPNILVWFSPHDRTRESADLIPADYEPPEDGVLFLPRQARYLPGTLYIHDLVSMGGEFYGTITGHNFLARLSLERGWERVWWPKAIDGLGPAAFNQNYFQLNSIAIGTAPGTSFFTAFSDCVEGSKPWKAGYGPAGRGVVFAGQTRDVIHRGLTCPHSARLKGGRLWLCNSGYGEVGYVEGYETLDPGRTRFVPVARAPGFTRGLAFADDILFVGLSKVIPRYEPYAPGLKPDETRCGIWAYHASTGKFLASLSWPQGYQIYDIQTLTGIKKPRLPLARRDSDGINPILRFLG